MEKSTEAFRTISEVADLLETPAHVLRFWESRFPQIRPVKRAGGRRYYRPADVALLSGIRHLLHAEGMTIRGVQKVLRDQGVRHVAAFGGGGDLPDLEQDAEAALEAALAANFGIESQIETPPEQAESATIVALESALRARDAARAAAPEAAPETETETAAETHARAPKASAAEPVETIDFTAAFAQLPEGAAPPLPGFELPSYRAKPQPVETVAEALAALQTLPRRGAAPLGPRGPPFGPRAQPAQRAFG